jgi:hypothetical protein
VDPNGNVMVPSDKNNAGKPMIPQNKDGDNLYSVDKNGNIVLHTDSNGNAVRFLIFNIIR